MKVKSERHRTTGGIESDLFGFGRPASPPTPAALRFITTGDPSQSNRYTPEQLSELQTGIFRDLARAAAEFADKADSLGVRARPTVLNPYGRMPEGSSLELLRGFSQALFSVSAAAFNETQRDAFSRLKKIAGSFAAYAESRPEALVQRHHSYMVDVLLDGCNAVIGSDLPQPREDEKGHAPRASTIKQNVRTGRIIAGLLHSPRDQEHVLEHISGVEHDVLCRQLPRVLDGGGSVIGMTAHELAMCFYAKQSAVAFAVAEKAREYIEKPGKATQDNVRIALGSALNSLSRTGTLSDNPFSSQYNDFRLILRDFAALLQLSRVRDNFENPLVLEVVRKFSALLRLEARRDAWSFPGVELAEKGRGRRLPASEINPGLEAPWAQRFRPNRALKKLAALDREYQPKQQRFKSCLDTISARLGRIISSYQSRIPADEPFEVGIYNAAESAVLPETFVGQTAAMQEEHRVPASDRDPRCGIMTITPQEEIENWAQKASVFSVQKGEVLLGALYSFTSQEYQPPLTGALAELIESSSSAHLIEPGTPVICTELVLTKKGGHEECGRIPANRYDLMHSLWAGSIAAEYYDHEKVLCLGVCRKNPLNTAISSHQRLGWKIVPDVEFRFDERATYYVMYQELYPRRSLLAHAKEKTENAEKPEEIRLYSDDTYIEDSTRPHQALRDLATFSRLPRWKPARHSAIALHANRVAAAVVGTLIGAALSGPTPAAFAKPKEFLLAQCGTQPVLGEARVDIELAKGNLSQTDRMELLEACLVPAGPDSLLFVDKYYLLTADPVGRKAVIEELRRVVQIKYPGRTVVSIIPDEPNHSGGKIDTACITLK